MSRGVFISSMPTCQNDFCGYIEKTSAISLSSLSEDLTQIPNSWQ